MKWVAKDGVEPTPEAFLGLIKGKSLSFLGDSLMGQHFREFVCKLAPLGAEKIERPDPNDPKWTWESQAMTFDPNHGYHRITFPGNTVVQFHFITGFISEVKDDRIFDADWIFFNFGAWVKKKYDMKTSLTSSINKLQRQSNAKLIWREYSPAHFPGESYDYRSNSSTYPCESRDGKSQENAEEDLRLRTANEIVSQHGISIMGIHADSVMHWEMHTGQLPPEVGSGTDCRHWCMPSPILDMWDQKLFAMLQ